MKYYESGLNIQNLSLLAFSLAHFRASAIVWVHWGPVNHLANYTNVGYKTKTLYVSPTLSISLPMRTLLMNVLLHLTLPVLRIFSSSSHPFPFKTAPLHHETQIQSAQIFSVSVQVVFRIFPTLTKLIIPQSLPEPQRDKSHQINPLTSKTLSVPQEKKDV